ncbi:MAG: acyl-phosphate glycerol 3-phosphate acyltransferase [Thermodesulfobacterium geofontis]|uniref:Glycerol-3-phosphate acyltransferase n=1 Tax=Thermodesulfobacterium geofontis TaxID=1295609 RepID=A0A2N7PQF4_9BACT|nr:MAG: acyl-phosphate glycerol 3-phosphate acyltransferase [Thermodesulfobacterium geofontis]
MFNYFFYFLLAYLLGSIPFALIIALPQGIDPRKEGSKNPGATNVARLLGKKWGILTFIGDSGKGILALYLVKLLTSLEFKENPFLYAGVAFFSVFGHLFSIFLKFKGGKGVATTIGTFLILTPKALFPSLVVFAVAVYVTNYVSVGSLLGVALLPLFIYLFDYPSEYVYTGIILAILIWIKHKDNIKRLLRGEEKTWKKK